MIPLVLYTLSNARYMDDIMLQHNNLRCAACISASYKNSTVDKASLYNLHLHKTTLE